MQILTIVAVLGMAVSCAAQVLAVKTYDTSGHPTEAIWTPDGQYVLVTVNGTGGSGIEVFRVEPEKLQRVAFQPLGSEPAQGILLIPHTQTLAVGVSDSGVAYLPLEAMLKGKAKPLALAQGEESGSGYLAVTPDGQTLFVANEYGEGGNVGVITLHRDTSGRINPVTVAHIPTRRATPGVMVSPDGTRVYAVGEVLPADIASSLPGHGAPELERTGCRQRIRGMSMANGALYVIDANKAAALTPDAAVAAKRDAVLRVFDAGCSPVREAETADGSTLYVTARGDNKVLVFDTKALEQDQAHAFLRAIPSGGEAPVGLALFDQDRMLLVANSNRFGRLNGNATVIDVSNPARPVRLQTISTGEFPRNITVSADGRTLLMTVFLGDELMVLTMK